MRRSQAQRLARWSAVAAMTIALLVAGVYLYRSAQVERARRAVPPPVPEAVEQRAAEFSFSRVEGERTVFTVRASRTTEFAGGDRALLEDVWVTIFGRRGDRHDTLHTRECNYLPAQSRVVCEGRVEMTLASRAADGAVPRSAIEVQTRNVSFDMQTGVASSDAPVAFRVPGGSGQAVGVRYDSREAAVHLLREIRLRFDPDDGAGPVEIAGERLAIERERREVRLSGRVRAARRNFRLGAQSLALELDEAMRATRLVASGAPVFETAGDGGGIRVTASQLAADLDGHGHIRRWRAAGGARMERRGGGGEERIEAEELALELVGGARPARFTARGDVRATNRDANLSQSLRTAELEAVFTAGPAPARLSFARTLAPAVFESAEAGRRLRTAARRFEAGFDSDGRLARIAGRDEIDLEQRGAGDATQSATAQSLAVRFARGAQWETMELAGAVRYRDAERTAQASRAVLERASGRIALSGAAAVTDVAARTTADSLVFDPRGGRMEAVGSVRSSFFSTGAEAVANLAAQPAQVAGERLAASRETGRAVYSGGVRLWQGDTVVEAAELELDRRAQTIEARGDARALVPPAPGREDAEGFWRIAAGRMRYARQSGTLRFEDGARAESRAGRITAQAMDVELAEQAGAQRVARAVATGSVVVEQGARRATAERGEYLAAEGSFTMTGGVPTITDASRGTASGRKLTFYIAGDKILLDSDEGTRTLTRHRVEK